VSSAEVAKKFDVFLHPKFGVGPRIFFGGGAFVNRHHFRPTGQVWLRSRSWSLIYADKIKTIINYSGKI